ncbi:hypothetical protein M569_06615 [Genlisea aurea]|uniref:Uncharacterized protein n=1 Tax=Genlisea aurea TaxID=192259 RepID=S8DY11_9LAMI|nr:hypothetical protein M569_06615 [Genlisea aurea]
MNFVVWSTVGGMYLNVTVDSVENSRMVEKRLTELTDSGEQQGGHLNLYVREWRTVVKKRRTGLTLSRPVEVLSRRPLAAEDAPPHVVEIFQNLNRTWQELLKRTTVGAMIKDGASEVLSEGVLCKMHLELKNRIRLKNIALGFQKKKRKKNIALGSTSGEDSYSDEILAAETSQIITLLQDTRISIASFRNKQKLRMENAQQEEEKIQCQNREALLKNMICCPTCGVPQKLRMENAQFIKHGAADLPASSDAITTQAPTVNPEGRCPL